VRAVGNDLIGVLLVAMLSLAIGLLGNSFSTSRISLDYHSPEQRLNEALTTLIKAPPIAPAAIQTIDLPALRKALAAKEVLVLDARPSSFYAEGHIPGALNLSREDFALDYGRLRPELDKARNRPIVVYCSGGDCHDSRMVAGALMSLGFSEVRVFTGGWAAWNEAKQPVAR
jgi:rhodanese-related sulfurtransferase